MTWNFRGSLSRVDFKRSGRITMPFRGCAWLNSHRSGGTLGLNTWSVRDAALELVEMDDLRVEAMQAEAASIAERHGLAAPAVSGCVYTLGETLHVVAGIEDATVAAIKNGLLPALLDGRLHVNAAVAFAGFGEAQDAPAAPSLTPSERAFDAGRGAVYFDSCNLSIAFNPWGVDATPESTQDGLVAVGAANPRL